MDKIPMTISVDRPSDALAVVKIAGEVGLTALVGAGGSHTGVNGDTLLAQALHEKLPDPPAQVIIDLTSATYLSSLGIGGLVRYARELTSTGKSMRLVATGHLITLLKFGKLDQIFKIYADVESAKAS